MNDFFPTVIFTHFDNMHNNTKIKMHTLEIKEAEEEKYVEDESTLFANNQVKELFGANKNVKIFIYNPKSRLYVYQCIKDKKEVKIFNKENYKGED
jgi:hypothetical protein